MTASVLMTGARGINFVKLELSYINLNIHFILSSPHSLLKIETSLFQEEWSEKNFVILFYFIKSHYMLSAN